MKPARKKYSQFNAEMILQGILEHIGEGDRRCCEVGAWDGLWLSNTAWLIRERGWSGTLIEGEEDKAAECRDNYINLPVNVVHAWLTAENANDLIPRGLDFLCVDIDGNDWYVLRSLHEDRLPRVLMIEYNFRKKGFDVMPYDAEFRKSEGTMNMLGASALSMIQLAEERGYSLAAKDLGCNLFFVQDALRKRLLGA